MAGRIITGNGKAWSDAGREAEAVLSAWLEASGLAMDELMRRVDGDGFLLDIARANGHVEIMLSDSDGPIGLPFVWDRGSGIPFQGFKLDASLVLACIRAACSNETSRRKIKEFLIGEKLAR